MMENYGEEIFMKFHLSLLHMDKAYLEINNNSSFPWELYSRYIQCSKCPFTKTSMQLPFDIIDVKYEKEYQIVSNGRDICKFGSDFGEFGVYQVNISNNDTCDITTLKEPVNIYLPILTVALMYTVLSLLIYSSVRVWYVYKKHRKGREGQDDNVEAERQMQGKSRVKSLDTFRGIAIVLMIFVNYQSGGYHIFDHVVWNGLHLGDVVFPWFLWIMGTCIPISMLSTFKRKLPQLECFWIILRRSCILFAIGIFLSNNYTELSTLRIMGVLQRFGICYFVVATTFILFNKKEDFSEQKGSFRDIFTVKFQWMTAIIFLLIHSYFTFWFEVPNCTRGYLGPGGNHENGTHFNCTGGATGYIDKLILGNHIYRNRHSPLTEIYKAEPIEPEGLLGCLTSIIQVIVGVQAGATFLLYKSDKSRVTRWCTWGVVTGLIGGTLCGFTEDDGLIPINKQLWSISFVLVTSSLAFFLLSACYYVIDVKGCWNGKPFIFCGMNAIILYAAHFIFNRNIPMVWFISKDRYDGPSTHLMQLTQNVWTTGAYIIIAYYLYKKNIFFKI